MQTHKKHRGSQGGGDTQDEKRKDTERESDMSEDAKDEEHMEGYVCT